VSAFKHIAEKRGNTLAQLSITWVGSKGKHIIPYLDLCKCTFPPHMISFLTRFSLKSKKSCTEENLAACDIKLTEEEMTMQFPLTLQRAVGLLMD